MTPAAINTTPTPAMLANYGGENFFLVGGTLSAGSTSDGGFTVRATLPAYVPTAVRR